MSIESIPQTWTESDTAFFTIVARLFSPEFTYGAGVLLASCDPGVADATTHSAGSVTAGSDITAGADADLVPVPVRRTR